MTFQVANGSIPAVVETWLLDEGGMSVRRVGAGWELSTYTDGGSESAFAYWPFDWPHDREPTLQEAIEAVAHATP